MDSEEQLSPEIVFVAEEKAKASSGTSHRIADKLFSSSAKAQMEKLLKKVRAQEKKSEPGIYEENPLDLTNDFQENPKFRQRKARLKLKSTSSASSTSSKKTSLSRLASLDEDSRKGSGSDTNSELPVFCENEEFTNIKELKSNNKKNGRNFLDSDSKGLEYIETDSKSPDYGTENSTSDNDALHCPLCGIKVDPANFQTHRSECLQNNFSRNSAEKRKEGSTAVQNVKCQMCNTDITHLNSQRRTQHMNACMDKKEAEKQGEDIFQQHLYAARSAVLSCPLCRKKLKTQTGRQSHLKKCAVANKMTVDQVRNLDRQQAEEHYAKLDAGILPDDFLPTKLNALQSKKAKISKPKSQLDEDTQLALALSTSMAEDQAQLETNLIGAFGGNTEFKRPESVELPRPLGKGQGKGRKGKQAETTSLLMTLPRHEAMERISHRVDHYVFSAMQETSVPNTPPFKTGKSSNSTSSATVESSLLSQKSQVLWSKTSLTGTASSLQESSTSLLPEPARSSSSSSGSDQANRELQFYVKELMPPVSVSSVITGSKIKRVSAIPGRRRSDEFQQLTDNKDEAEDQSSTSPSVSQTVQILAELAMENDVTPDGKERMRASQLLPTQAQTRNGDDSTDMETSGFYKESLIKNISEDPQKLTASYLSLINCANFSDVSIQTHGGTELHAHKVILHARCPYLLSICAKQDGKEVIDLSQFGEESVMCMLRYVYAGDISLYLSCAAEVMQLANRFSLPELAAAVPTIDISSGPVNNSAVESNGQSDYIDERNRENSDEESQDESFDEDDRIDVFMTQRETLRAKSAQALSSAEGRAIDGSTLGDEHKSVVRQNESEIVPKVMKKHTPCMETLQTDSESKEKNENMGMALSHDEGANFIDECHDEVQSKASEIVKQSSVDNYSERLDHCDSMMNTIDSIARDINNLKSAQGNNVVKGNNASHTALSDIGHISEIDSLKGAQGNAVTKGNNVTLTAATDKPHLSECSTDNIDLQSKSQSKLAETGKDLKSHVFTPVINNSTIGQLDGPIPSSGSACMENDPQLIKTFSTQLLGQDAKNTSIPQARNSNDAIMKQLESPQKDAVDGNTSMHGNSETTKLLSLLESPNTSMTPKRKKKKMSVKEFKGIVKKMVSDDLSKLENQLTDQEVAGIQIKIEQDLLANSEHPNDTFYIPSALDKVEEGDDITITQACIQKSIQKKKKRRNAKLKAETSKTDSAESMVNWPVLIEGMSKNLQKLRAEMSPSSACLPRVGSKPAVQVSSTKSNIVFKSSLASHRNLNATTTTALSGKAGVTVSSSSSVNSGETNNEFTKTPESRRNYVDPSLVNQISPFDVVPNSVKTTKVFSRLSIVEPCMSAKQCTTTPKTKIPSGSETHTRSESSLPQSTSKATTEASDAGDGYLSGNELFSDNEEETAAANCANSQRNSQPPASPSNVSWMFATQPITASLAFGKRSAEKNMKTKMPSNLRTTTVQRNLFAAEISAKKMPCPHLPSSQSLTTTIVSLKGNIRDSISSKAVISPQYLTIPDSPELKSPSTDTTGSKVRYEPSDLMCSKQHSETASPAAAQLESKFSETDSTEVNQPSESSCSKVNDSNSPFVIRQRIGLPPSPILHGPEAGKWRAGWSKETSNKPVIVQKRHISKSTRSKSAQNATGKKGNSLPHSPQESSGDSSLPLHSGENASMKNTNSCSEKRKDSSLALGMTDQDSSLSSPDKQFKKPKSWTPSPYYSKSVSPQKHDKSDVITSSYPTTVHDTSSSLSTEIPRKTTRGLAKKNSPLFKSLQSAKSQNSSLVMPPVIHIDDLDMTFSEVHSKKTGHSPVHFASAAPANARDFESEKVDYAVSALQERICTGTTADEHQQFSTATTTAVSISTTLISGISKTITLCSSSSPEVADAAYQTEQHRLMSTECVNSSPLPLRQRLGLTNPFKSSQTGHQGQSLGETAVEESGSLAPKAQQVNAKVRCSAPKSTTAGVKLVSGTSTKLLDDGNNDDEIIEDDIAGSEQQNKESGQTNEIAKTPVQQTATNMRKRKAWNEPSPFTPMAPYDDMNTPELKKAVTKIGVRPVGKKRMRQLLKHVYEERHQYETDSDYDGTPVKQTKTDSQSLIPGMDKIMEDQSSDSGGTKTQISSNLSPKKLSKAAEYKIGSQRAGQSRVKCKQPEKSQSTTAQPTGSSLSEGSSCDNERDDDMPGSQDSSYSDSGDVPEESILQGWPEDELAPTQMTQSSTEAAAEKLELFVRENQDVYEQILMYEPLELDVLKKRLTEAGIRIGMAKILDFLDERCITFTMKNMTTWNNTRHRRAQPKKSGTSYKKGSQAKGSSQTAKSAP